MRQELREPLKTMLDIKLDVLAKRVIDVSLSLLVLVASLPLWLVSSLAIKLTSPGPVFYRWDVIGRNGVPFTGYIFRSMVVNADELKKDIRQHNDRNGSTFKLKNDPRVTPVGPILRKFSQLWSVLKGDMSLVGPRPVAPSEWEHFEDWQRCKLGVTPGMICLWHIRGKRKHLTEWIAWI